MASPDRWRQIVADTESIATRQHEWAAKYGWSTEDLFAFDLDHDRTWESLIMRVRGGRVLIGDDSLAFVSRPDGSTIYHYRAGSNAVPAGAKLIWSRESMGAPKAGEKFGWDCKMPSYGGYTSYMAENREFIGGERNL